MTLKEVKDKLAALTSQATAKRAEIKDDTATADVTRIEGEHGALLAQIVTLRAEITAAEKEEADAAAALTTVDADAVTRAAQAVLAAERTRTATISELGRTFNQPAMAQAAIASGVEVQAFRNSLIDELAKQSNRFQTNGNVQITQDETVVRRDNVVEYLAQQAASKPLTEKTKEYRGMKLTGFAREVLSWEGVATRGMTDSEIATRALNATSDFPNILAAVANKTLLAAYQARPRTFPLWTRRINLGDFKTLNMLRLGQNPGLKLINEHGEFKRGTIAEGKETIGLKTYGIVFGITRQAIVNDDLGAFTDVPGRFGQSAATLESDLVYGKLLANPVLNTDSKEVFHAAHNNLVSSGSAAPSIATISTGRVAMAKQKDLDNVTVLNLSPSIILVPPELETTAAQLITSFTPAVSSNIVPEYIRTMTPISEPRLSVGISNADIGVNVTGSAAAWYLVASQGVDTIVYAYLDGQDGPFVESRPGFNIDGIEIRCRHDFGVAIADYRGLYKNNG